jgi:hypothetical protein
MIWQSDGITRQPRMSVGAPAVFLLLLILLAVCPTAGAQQIQLAIGSASGPPGGTAGIPFTLTDPTNTGVGAGLLVLFPAGTQDALSINLPNDCTIAPRLSDTHILAAVRLNEPPGGQGFDLEIAPNPNAPGSPNLPIGTGDIATCIFHIPDGSGLGVTTTLTANSVLVSNANAQALPATGVNGAVTVALVTPTATSTMVGPTNTPTATRTSTVQPPTNTPTPTNTSPPPTSTATATRTKTPVGPTPTNTIASGGGGGGGCTIAAPGSPDASPMVWLIVPAALLLWRRRGRG